MLTIPAASHDGPHVAKHHKGGQSGVNKTTRKAANLLVSGRFLMEIHIRMGISMPSTHKTCVRTASTLSHSPSRLARSPGSDSDRM